MKVKLSDYVLRLVADRGVRHVFFVPGGGAMHLNDSLGRCEGVQYIVNLHEQASAIAAEAYARITNHLGVAMVTTGPGATNAITGVAGAWLDSTPCLIISGQVKRADMKGDSAVRILGVQEIDIVSIVRSITKYAVTITDPSSIRYHLEKAMHLATTGRRGPVWIDIPLDVQAATVDPEALPAFSPPEGTRGPQRLGLEQQIHQLVTELDTCHRPVLLLGNGVRAAGAESLLSHTLALWDLPVLTSWLGIDLLPDDHRNNFGRPGSLAPRGANFVLQNSDLLVIVGCRLDMAMTAYAHDRLARGARKVMVDIDEAEIRKMRTVIELPIVSDAKDFFSELTRQGRTSQRKTWPDWFGRCERWRTTYPIVLPEHRPSAGANGDNSNGRLSMYHFSEVLSAEMEEGEIISPGSSGFACEIFLLVLKIKQNQRVFHNRGTGAMGFGLPAAIGACIAAGRRRTVSVDGDGGFQMNIQELATVAHLSLPIKFFVINNGGYASIRTSQRGYFNRLVGADETSGLALPSVGKVAAAYGIQSESIRDPYDLAGQIRRILDLPGPVVCEVIVRRDEQRVPRAASRQRPDGSMVSTPLEDLWPYLDRDEFAANMLIPIIEE